MKPPIKRMARAYKDSRAAFKNAQNLIDDAAAMRRRGSYGRAFSLLVLAEEEIGKGFFLQWETVGFEIPDHILRSHKAKQAMMMHMAMLDFFITDVILAWRRIMLTDLDNETKTRRIKQAVDRINARKMKGGEPARQAFWDEMAFYETLDQRKMDGFYVDTSGGTGARTPDSISKEEVAEYARKVRRRYKRIVEFWGGPEEVTDEALIRQWETWQETKEVFGPRAEWMQGYYGAVAKQRTVVPENLPPLPKGE